MFFLSHHKEWRQAVRWTLLLPDCSRQDEVGDLEAKSFYPLNNSSTSVGLKHDHSILDTIPGLTRLEWQHGDTQKTSDLVQNSRHTHRNNNLNGGAQHPWNTRRRNGMYFSVYIAKKCHLWHHWILRRLSLAENIRLPFRVPRLSHHLKLPRVSRRHLL